MSFSCTPHCSRNRQDGALLVLCSLLPYKDLAWYFSCFQKLEVMISTKELAMEGTCVGGFSTRFQWMKVNDLFRFPYLSGFLFLEVLCLSLPA